MKTIGLLGGMSWESSAHYYRAINEGIKNALGNLHSAKIAMYSVDFAPIEKLQHEGDWAGTASILSEAAGNVEAAGADFLLICTNTMHKVAGQVSERVDIPLVHIADATGEAVMAAGCSSVGLLGTRFAMEEDFLKGYLRDRYHLKVMVPAKPDRDLVHRVIYQELCLGRIEEASRRAYVGIVETLAAAGAEGVILGCTEIPLLLRDGDVELRLFDTTALHAQKAVDLALGTGSFQR